MRTSGLPSDLLQLASQRFGTVCLIYAAAYGISYGVTRSVHFERLAAMPAFWLYDPICILSILSALLMFLLVHSKRLPPQLLLDIGLIYWAVGAIGIDLHRYFFWFGTDRGSIVDISWVCVWLVLFPLIVPASPGKVLLAALVTASMGPLSMLVALASGLATFPASVSLRDLIVPYYLCAGIAFAGSRVIYSLGKDVSEARELGSYKLIERLGGGGMGEVWLATHRLLARQAAIKLIRPDILVAHSGAGAPGPKTPGGGHGARQLRPALDPTGPGQVILRRFEREAQVTATLTAPHTVRLFDFGTTEDGSFYYAMELLDGLDLETLVKDYGPVQPPRTIHLLLQACDSLDEAQYRGLVHRDIKPSNIYVCRVGRQHDFVKVLDFGLVKQNTGVESTRLTEIGLVTGTPAFMPPEIALGKDEIDGRADIYSLGCVAYWMLTGQLVFEAKRPLEMAMKHVREEPVPPSRRSELEIPDKLEEAVLSCLAKDPDNRPQTSRELRRMLSACEVPEPWTRERAEQWWELHRPSETPRAPQH